MKYSMAVVAVCVMGVCVTQAAERNLADGLAAAGAATAAKGNVAQAKDLLFAALAHDENCPDAIFELAKIVEKEGNASNAGDLYQRAALLMGQEAKPDAAAKRAEAEKRAKTLNPVAAKLSASFEEYAQGLEKVVKKLPDPLTESTAVDRVNEVQLANVLPNDKLPKFYVAALEKKAAPASSGGMASGNRTDVTSKVAAMVKDNKLSVRPDSDMFGDPAPGRTKSLVVEYVIDGTSSTKEAHERRRLEINAPPGKTLVIKKATYGETVTPGSVGSTAPEVEAELKALGWTTVSGTWVKKATGIYEGTDAKLEAPKINGGIDFSVIAKGGEGNVKAMVRTEEKKERGGPPGFPGFGEPDMRGYGIHVKDKEFKDYAYGESKFGGPGGGGGGKGGGKRGGNIVTLHTYPLQEGAPKNHFAVKIEDSTLDVFYNDVRKDSVNNSKCSHTGTFVLEVSGTLVIEAPRCVGQ